MPWRLPIGLGPVVCEFEVVKVREVSDEGQQMAAGASWRIESEGLQFWREVSEV